MNAINHAATALIIKKYYPSVPIIPILVSVQLIEMLWVVLNIAGIEQTEFSNKVSSLADVHLVHMPYSHSLLFTLLWAFSAWFIVSKILNKPRWGLPLFIGVCSHIVLDLATHTRDIEIIPFLNWPELGSGLYGIPLAALCFEIGYSVLCWRIINGSKFTLIALLILNLFSLSFYVPQISGPEGFLSDYPAFFAPVIGIHILFGLVSVWYLSKREQVPNNQLKRTP
jgi:membrane-bound metal-dependent hydrolase YbcI (DUF457 family)